MSIYSIIRAAIRASVFIILGIMILVGKVDKLFTRQKEKDMETPWYHRSLLAFKGIEKYDIKRLRLVWGVASFLFAVSWFFRDFLFMIILISAIVLTLVAFILQETWAKKKDSDL